MDNTEVYALTITQIPVNISEQELKWKLHLSGKRCQILHFIPLDNYIVAEVLCRNRDDYERLLNVQINELGDNFRGIKIMKSSCTTTGQDEDRNLNNINLCHLPLEILYKIFEMCPLTQQLSLAKVCTQFYNLISTIWQKKFQYFCYDYQEFRYKLKLDDKTIRDLCIMGGKHVRRVRFLTYLNMNLLHDISGKLGGNSMESLKYFINDNFRQNVKHFANLQELEVCGNFMLDIVAVYLVTFCKQLKTLRFIDASNFWLKGIDLWKFENLENLYISACPKFDCDNFLLISKRCRLKELNIVQCNALQSVPRIMEFATYWQHLMVLKITAFTADRPLLSALLALPVLQNLQFFWINFMPVNFEENFFAELFANEHKRQHLTQLNYENNRYNIESEHMQVWTPMTYAIMRENVCINGQEWRWSNDMFNMFASLMHGFTLLQEINFNYCRLIDYDQLKQLPRLNHRLQLVQIRGCAQRDDEQFYKEWCQDVDAKHHKCQLKLNSLLNYQEVMKLRSQAEARQYSSYYRRDPVLRSIECQFYY